MIDSFSNLTFEQCQQARLSRDPRFDGRFFIAVKSTGIFCRTICPARMPKEENVEYFGDKTVALEAGYRPCLRCRPDSAPHSWAWKGVETTFSRAVKLIDEGALNYQSLQALSERLGVSDRYLRKLFSQYLGMSPKQYSLYQQLLFAKHLLHTSTLSITDIGYAVGFQSTRRFNDAFRKQLKMSPSDIRRKRMNGERTQVTLNYQGELNWAHLMNFYQVRAIEGLELVEEDSYSRTVVIQGKQAWFKATPNAKGQILLALELEDISILKPLITNVRRMLDLDANIDVIEQHLENVAPGIVKSNGIRIPGGWSAWEAGVRAILGQQVSVKAAIGQLNLLVKELSGDEKITFPTPQQVADADLNFLRMPQSRKDTLARFAQFNIDNPEATPDEWLSIKGIGPWTVNYALLRGLSLPNHYLDSDLVVKKWQQQYPNLNKASASPWGSYATFHLWNHA